MKSDGLEYRYTFTLLCDVFWEMKSGGLGRSFDAFLLYIFLTCGLLIALMNNFKMDPV
jgi:ABC-type uncharacterized transport system permease subunit